MGRACGTLGAIEKYIRLSVEKPEGKGSFGRPRYREAGSVKRDLREQGWKDTVPKRSVVNRVIKLLSGIC